MSADGEEGIRHEIIIVRRRGGNEDEGHHGAAWKIAYADFMTAMMAFFLVMWLVNAASKKQVIEVAAYFNPIKLTDKVTSPKGVHKMELDESTDSSDDSAKDQKKDEHNKLKSKVDAAAGPPVKGAALDSSKKPDAAEGQSKLIKSGSSRHDAGHGSRLQDAANEELFRDPFGMLTRLAAESPAMKPSTSAPLEVPASGLDVSSDPFDPKGRRQAAAGTQQKSVHPAQVVALDAAVSKAAEAAEADSAPKQPSKAGPTKPVDVAASQPVTDPVASGAAKLAQQIEAAVKARPPSSLPSIEVARVAEGVLISLTDKSDFGMFGLGAAVPQPGLVRLVGDIGKILAGTPGDIVVRGHTDARPYRSESYDNWRLSTSRAHAAYFMLVKGGLDEKRVTRVEGYADRVPKNPADPLAPSNRRIELLIKEAKP